MAIPQSHWSNSMSDTSNFHLFPRLPTEIRLEIRRASLPRRIIRLASRRLCPGPSDDIIQIWQSPPSIARVCQEARSVAFEHGHLRWAEHVVGPDSRWAKTWVDPTKDLIFIDTVTDLPESIPEDILVDHVLADAKQAKAVVLSWDYINYHHIEHTARLFTTLHNPFLFIVRKYVVHMSKRDAIDSGLFGYGAEETAVLVDYKDKDRLKAFAPVCSIMSENIDELKEHINSLENSSESQTMRDESEQGDFLRMWLRLQRHGIPKYERAKADPRYEGLYDKFGFLNYEHQLVKTAKDSMPKYRRVFIFELCLNSRHLLLEEHLDSEASDNVFDNLVRLESYNTEMLRKLHIHHNPE